MPQNKKIKKSDVSPDINHVYDQISKVLEKSRKKTYQAINHEMVQCYWNIGRIIVEEEQAGKGKADYGKYLIGNLSKLLRSNFGSGFNKANLYDMRLFYQNYPKVSALPRELSWTHYKILLRVEKKDAKSFYEQEAVNSNWSTRELERQIHSLLFDRLLMSKDKNGVLELAQKGHVVQKPSDLLKDPYVLEFTGLPQNERILESDLEQALIDKLQQFLLELGKGFAFMARQQRITLDGQHFYVDLVFYNRLTRSFVLIDLKAGALTHQDIGQMQMYVNYYQRNQTSEDENPPIGIILCTDKSEAVVRYTLPEDNKQIFASRYKLYLPTEEELAEELKRERKEIELLQKISGKEDM